VQDTTPQLGGQLDVNGNAIGDGTLELLAFTETGSAVNHVNVTNAATGNAPSVSAVGDDTNVDLNLAGKGTGQVQISGAYKLPSSDGSNGQVLTTDGSGGVTFGSVAGTGDVVGPASSTNNSLAQFDGTTGKLLKDGAVIGTDVQAYDADTLFADTSDNLVVGYTTDVEALGSVTSITPDLTAEWLKSATITGNLTINEPTDGSTGGCIMLLTADGSGPYTVTLGAGVSAVGTTPDLAASTSYECRVVKHSDTLTTAEIVEIG
jgi:hypothetical protein